MQILTPTLREEEIGQANGSVSDGAAVAQVEAGDATRSRHGSGVDAVRALCTLLGHPAGGPQAHQFEWQVGVLPVPHTHCSACSFRLRTRLTCECVCQKRGRVVFNLFSNLKWIRSNDCICPVLHNARVFKGSSLQNFFPGNFTNPISCPR